jgi:hypothetical protein
MPFEAIHMQRFSHSERVQAGKTSKRERGERPACFEIPTEAHTLLCVRGILDKNAAHKKANEQIAKQPSTFPYTAGAHRMHLGRITLLSLGSYDNFLQRTLFGS